MGSTHPRLHVLPPPPPSEDTIPVVENQLLWERRDVTRSFPPPPTMHRVLVTIPDSGRAGIPPGWLRRPTCSTRLTP